MTDRRHGLDSVTACFPDHAALIRRLCLSDPSFRDLCEEYALARTCLSRFEALGDASRDAEISDYRRVIRALECEICCFFQRSV